MYYAIMWGFDYKFFSGVISRLSELLNVEGKFSNFSICKVFKLLVLEDATNGEKFLFFVAV